MTNTMEKSTRNLNILADLQDRAKAFMSELQVPFNGAFYDTGTNGLIKFIVQKEIDGKVKKINCWLRCCFPERKSGEVGFCITFGAHHSILPAQVSNTFWPNGDSITEEQRQKFKEDREREKKNAIIREKKQKDIEDSKAKWCEERYNGASTNVKSAYCFTKRIQPIGIRQETRIQYSEDGSATEELIDLIPLRNAKGEIRALQEIYHTQKTFGDDKEPRNKNTIGSYKSCFFTFGKLKNGEPIHIAEGYSTSNTIFECTGKTTLMAVARSNLKNVAIEVHKLCPNSVITICGDDDVDTKGNPGRTDAIAAANHINSIAGELKCKVVFPAFETGKERDSDDNGYKDFNDMMILRGEEAVKKQINSALPPQQKKENNEKNSMKQTVPEEPSTQTTKTSIEKPIRFWEEEGMTYQKFPVDVLPLPLKYAAQEVTKSMQVPIEMSAGLILSATATSFHNLVTVVEKIQLEHFITFFFMVVGMSSERKSKTFERVMGPLIKHTMELKESYEKGIISFRGMKKAIETQIREISGNIKSNTNENDLVKFGNDIAKLEAKLKSYEPSSFKFYTTDSTEQAFVKCLERNQGCFSLLTSEGGDCLDYISGSNNNNNKTNDSVFLKVTTGDTIGRERVGDNKGGGESIYLPKPCGNILVMIQPDRFYSFMANPALRNCGLISRVSPILAHENSMVGKRMELDENGKIKNQTVADMSQYEELLLRFLRNKKQIKVSLSESAALARAQFHDSIERQLGIGGDLRDVADIAGKATSFATKLAALFHLSKYPDIFMKDNKEIVTEISEETFIEAEIMQKYFLGQAINTQRTTEHQKQLNTARDVLRWLIAKKREGKYGVFAYSDIYNNMGGRPKLNAEGTKIIVQLLVKNGWAESVPGEKERYRLRKSAETEES